MQPYSQRRVHGAEFKAQVLAQCQLPGASVAAVALAHGLNVYLVRKWLVGRGLKRTGPVAPREVTTAAPPLQFVGRLDAHISSAKGLASMPLDQAQRGAC